MSKNESTEDWIKRTKREEAEANRSNQDFINQNRPLGGSGGNMVNHQADTSDQDTEDRIKKIQEERDAQQPDESNEAYELLDQFVKIIFQNPDAEIIIKGYTDSSGSDSYNISLSKFRANIVKSYFVGQGLNPPKIKTFGMGSENPIESNATIQGRRANRRIEIELKTNKS